MTSFFSSPWPGRDGSGDRLRAHMHSIIIREWRAGAPRSARDPMPLQSCANACGQAGHRGDSRAWSSEPVRAHLPGPVRLVHAGCGIALRASSRLTVDAGRLSQCDPAHAHAGLPPVGDAGMRLVLVQMSRTDLLGNVHGGTIPVRRRFRSCRSIVCPPLRHAPPVSLGHAHGAGGLREVHGARLGKARRSGAASPHISPRVGPHALEHPFVHPILPSVDQVLQRSLEPALSARRTGGAGRRDSTVTDVLFPDFLGNGNAPRRLFFGPGGGGRPGMVPDVGLMSAKSPGVLCGGVWVWVVSVFGYAREPLGACAPRGFLYGGAAACYFSHTLSGAGTIAVPGLSFRVRNGTGRLTWAMAAANLLLYGQTLGSAGLWQPGNRIADAMCWSFVLWPDNAHCRLVSFAGG